MTKRKLKEWVLPVLGIFVLSGALLCYYLIGKITNYSVTGEPSYITDGIIDNTINVNNEVEEIISIKPINSDKVIISKYYYKTTDEASKQQNSLIRYANIYMPNTGILYSSDEQFDCIAVLDGKITSIKEDEILGNIVEIEHNNHIISVYQSVADVKVKVGDEVKQGDVIALSGSNKLENEKANCLHFEVYKDGSLINPEEFFEKNIENLE